MRLTAGFEMTVEERGTLMSGDQTAAFEGYPAGVPKDDADVNVRAYVAGLRDEKLTEYDPSWNDEELMAWDGNFRSDGALMLVCCQRDVDVREYRRILELFLEFRRLPG